VPRTVVASAGGRHEPTRFRSPNPTPNRCTTDVCRRVNSQPFPEVQPLASLDGVGGATSNSSPSQRKIGVLTFHRCINYGSFWQASCLVQWLRKNHYDATILNHVSRRVNFAEWKCAVRPTGCPSTARQQAPLYRAKIESFLDATRTLPLSKPFALDDPSDMEPVDVAVIGSDEVWNFSHPWYRGSEVFYGGGIKAERLVSYAASFGGYTGAVAPDRIDRLRAFNSISVRDTNSRRLLSESAGINSTLVLDPCLLSPPERSADGARDLDEPYIAVYGHDFSSPFIQRVTEYARARRWRVISIGYANLWADEQRIDLSPSRFPAFLWNAELVATNFFHGCVFALAGEKQFVCETMPYRMTKIHDLMELMRTRDRLLDATPPGSMAPFEEPVNPQAARRISELRHVSESFLHAALN
jgi:hypothetical protein